MHVAFRWFPPSCTILDMPDVPAEVAYIRGELAARGTPAHRQSLQRFFKEPVASYGVRTPEFRLLAREVSARLAAWPKAARNRLCRELWAGGTLEEGGMAIEIQVRLAGPCGACEFKLFERWIARYVRNWAHCDIIACTLLAPILAREPELARELTVWTASPNRWLRRAAAVALVKEARQGRSTELIFAIAGRLASDPDDMVRKGLGWLLKDSYPRHGREVDAFLAAHPELPALVRRLALEKAPRRKTARA